MPTDVSKAGQGHSPSSETSRQASLGGWLSVQRSPRPSAGLFLETPSFACGRLDPCRFARMSTKIFHQNVVADAKRIPCFDAGVLPHSRSW